MLCLPCAIGRIAEMFLRRMGGSLEQAQGTSAPECVYPSKCAQQEVTDTIFQLMLPLLKMLFSFERALSLQFSFYASQFAGQTRKRKSALITGVLV